MVNHYSVLGIPNFSSVKEVRKAYIAQIRKYHPDLNPSPAAEEMSKRLNVAKEALETEERKAVYDRQLQNFLAYGKRTTYTYPPASKPVSPEEKRRQWKATMAERKARSKRFKAKRNREEYIDSLKYVSIHARYAIGVFFYAIGLFFVFAFSSEMGIFVALAMSIPLFIGSTIVSASAYRHIATFQEVSTLPYNLEKRTFYGIIIPTVLPIFLSIIITVSSNIAQPKEAPVITKHVISRALTKGIVVYKLGNVIVYNYEVDSVQYTKRATTDEDISLGEEVIVSYNHNDPNSGRVEPNARTIIDYLDTAN